MTNDLTTSELDAIEDKARVATRPCRRCGGVGTVEAPLDRWSELAGVRPPLLPCGGCHEGRVAHPDNETLTLVAALRSAKIKAERYDRIMQLCKDRREASMATSSWWENNPISALELHETPIWKAFRRASAEIDSQLSAWLHENG